MMKPLIHLIEPKKWIFNAAKFMNGYESLILFSLPLPLQTIWTQLHIMINGIGCRKKPIDWAEISTRELAKGTRPHTPISNTNGRTINLYNTSCRPQHVDKQVEDVTKGELQFGKSRVPDWANVPLNEDMNLEQFEHCSARVAIHPSVQQNSLEQN